MTTWQCRRSKHDRWHLGIHLGEGLCPSPLQFPRSYWHATLASNLAIASLLCRAADLAYQNGVDDNESEYWTGRGDLGPYPERAP